jgi:hypothetical protein
MVKYVTKPIVVEARQFHGTRESGNDIEKWLRKHKLTVVCSEIPASRKQVNGKKGVYGFEYKLDSPYWEHEITRGWWVIVDDYGLRAMSNEFFHDHYEPLKIEAL